MGAQVQISLQWMRDYQAATDKPGYLRDWASQLFLEATHCYSDDRLGNLMEMAADALRRANGLDRDAYNGHRVLMDSSPLVVRYPNGSFRFGTFHGHAHMADDRLAESAGQAWDGRGAPRDRQTHYDPGEGLKVRVWTPHGGGFGWIATATEQFLTSNREIRDDLVPVQYRKPKWLPEVDWR